MEFLKWIVTSITVAVSSILGIEQVPPVAPEQPIDTYVNTRSLAELRMEEGKVPSENPKDQASNDSKIAAELPITSVSPKQAAKPAASPKSNVPTTSVAPPGTKAQAKTGTMSGDVLKPKRDQALKALAAYQPALVDSFVELIQNIRSSTRTDIPKLKAFASTQGSAVEQLSSGWKALFLTQANIPQMDETALNALLDKSSVLTKTQQMLLQAYNSLPIAEFYLLEGKSAIQLVPNGTQGVASNYNISADQAQAFTLTIIAAQGSTADYVIEWGDGKSDKGTVTTGKPTTIQHVFSAGVYEVVVKAGSTEESIIVGASPSGNGGDKIEIVSPKNGWKFDVVTKIPITISVKDSKVVGSARLYMQSKKDAPLATGYFLGEMLLTGSNPTKSFELKNIAAGTYWIQAISTKYQDCTTGTCSDVLPTHRIGPVEITDITSYHETGIMPSDVESGAQGLFISP